MKIKCLNNIAQVGLDEFTDEYQMTDKLEEADAVLVRSANMHEVEFSDKLACIARAGAGVNNIPVDRCSDEGIVVFNTPGANANGVKELVIAGLLLAARDIIGGNKWVEENRYDEGISKLMEKAKKNYAGTEIKGKTLGVIGLGAIGIEVANVADALGMKIIGYDPFLSVNSALRLSRHVKFVDTLEPVWAESDYITLHVPLLDATRGMVNKESIAQMKDGVAILNYARDLLVDHDDMKEALADGKVRCYMTDFPNQQTAEMVNCIATPHLGASTSESEDNCAVMAVDEIRDFLETGRIKNSVNFPNCSMAPEPCACRICIMNTNRPNMITQFTSLLSKAGINIPNMTNKSRGNVGYTLIDCDTIPTAEILSELKAIDGVKRIRVIFY